MNRRTRKRKQRAEELSMQTGMFAPQRGMPVKHTGRPQGGPQGRRPKRIELYDKGAH